MISRHKAIKLLLCGSLVGLIGCTPKEPATPAPDLEQLKLQSQMKALASEVIKLRESREDVELLKADIAAMDSQIVQYQELLAKKAEEPKIEVVATPRDPDIINIRGNIYVLIREIDSLKEGMKDLEILNDSLEMQIEQLAVRTHTELNLDPKAEKMVIEEAVMQMATTASDSSINTVDETLLAEEPVMAPPKKAQGYSYNTDYRMAYNDALNKYFNNEFLEAIQDFKVLIEREPYGAYADNAQYWIGECYYSLEDFESAITEFEKVFVFQENNKSDHALFKIAISYQQLGRYMKARENMSRFIQDYPDSELISQAQDFLQGNNRN